MRTLEEAISDYEHGLAEVFSETPADPESRLLAVLLARDEIAALLDVTLPLSVGTIDRIRSLDRKFKSSIREAAALIWGAKFGKFSRRQKLLVL